MGIVVVVVVVADSNWVLRRNVIVVVVVVVRLPFPSGIYLVTSSSFESIPFLLPMSLPTVLLCYYQYACIEE